MVKCLHLSIMSTLEVQLSTRQNWHDGRKLVQGRGVAGRKGPACGMGPARHALAWPLQMA